MHEVGSKAICTRITFSNTLTQIMTAAEDEVYAVANMTTDKRVQHQVRLSDAEIEATTRCIADTDLVGKQLQREIYAITSMSRHSLRRNSPSA